MSLHLQGQIENFPEVRANYQSGIILQIFCWKQHENERIWTPGGTRVPGAPLDPSVIWVPIRS